MKDIKKFQQMRRDGQLSRRDFLAAMSALGVSATAAGGFLTSAKALAATPKKGGLARAASNLHGPDDQMDPIVFTSGIDYTRGRATYNNLVQMLDGMSLHPELAEEWTPNSDATEFTFKIQKGVEFHDGSSLTADDVVWSMNRHLGDDSPSVIKAFFTNVAEWKKVDSHTVKAILATPNSDLPQILGTFHFKIVQDGGAEKEGYFNLPAGTGPFRITEFRPGVRSLHERNPDYWRDGPNVDELELFAITDSVARVNALISGDIDIMGNIDPKAIKQVEATDGVEVFSVESGATTHIVAMVDREPTNNKDFVLALKHLQNREKLVRSLLKGHGSVGNDHVIGPAYADHCKALPIRPYDPDKAKFHLDKSGVDKAVVHTADVSPGSTDLCLVLQAEAAKIGLDLEVKKVAADGYWGTTWINAPLHITGWNMRPTANVMMSLMHFSEAPWNETKWMDERFDKLLVEVRGVTDPGLREEMNCEMQTMIHNDAGTILSLHRSYVDAIKSEVKGLPRVPLAAVGGCEWPEFVWLDT
jgi:peptide/nickel transport system substrate-binding protein